MAIQLGEEDKPYNEINVTPMIDVMMVLLIIFILLTTAAVQGIKVDLPSASSARTLDQNKSRVIAVGNDGTISIDAVPVSLSELEGELRRSMASTPDLAVILRGDRAVQYDRIMQVLDLCSKVGVPSLGMASTRPPGGGN
jgi:biopolymer transport protein ExbD